MPIGMDPCLIFGLGSMLASEILWHMLHHRTMPFRIDYGFRVFGMGLGEGSQKTLIHIEKV